MKMRVCRDGKKTSCRHYRLFLSQDMPYLLGNGIWTAVGIVLIAERTESIWLAIPGMPDLDPGDGPVEVRLSAEVVEREGKDIDRLKKAETKVDETRAERDKAWVKLDKAGAELESLRNANQEAVPEPEPAHEQPEGTLSAEELEEAINDLIPMWRDSKKIHEAHEAIQAHIASEPTQIQAAEKAAREGERARIVAVIRKAAREEFGLSGVTRLMTRISMQENEKAKEDTAL